MLSLLRARFIREIAGVAALVVASVVLTMYLVPPKIVTQTKTVEVPVRGTMVAPEYARRYAEAFCANDAKYLVAHTSPLAVSPEAIYRSVESNLQAGRDCKDAGYLGAYRSSDIHVFTAIFGPGGKESFLILTFESGLVVNIE